MKARRIILIFGIIAILATLIFVFLKSEDYIYTSIRLREYLPINSEIVYYEYDGGFGWGYYVYHFKISNDRFISKIKRKWAYYNENTFDKELNDFMSMPFSEIKSGYVYYKYRFDKRPATKEKTLEFLEYIERGSYCFAIYDENTKILYVLDDDF